MVIVAWLLKNWKIFFWGAVAIGLALYWWRITVWHRAYSELPKVQAALQAEVECKDGSKCQERQQILEKRASDEEEKIRKEYEQQLADINARPVPVEPVRLCRPAGSGGVRVSRPAAGAGPNAGTELPVEVGRDIKVELYRLIDDTDKEALKLRLLWERNMALSVNPATEKDTKPD